MELVDAPRGFEPRLTESESVVLPLDDGALAQLANLALAERCVHLVSAMTKVKGKQPNLILVNLPPPSPRARIIVRSPRENCAGGKESN